MNIRKKVVIAGAGNLGREIYSLLQPLVGKLNIEIAGFIDDTLMPAEKFNEIYPVPVLGKIAEYVPAENELILLAISEPQGKLKVAQGLEERGATFFSFVHPTSQVADSAKLGKGIVIFPFCFISTESYLGDFTLMNSHSAAGHDAQVGVASTVCSHVDLTGFVKLGKCVFVGSHASILPHVEVGDFARIGAGSTVVKRVKEHTTVYSAPARTL
ncbi:NeuD/PglB/VioB family sugar acetyltransferase [Undibacterium sp. SXout11W]|uniref:NeuD/PglB/VioB family sugar acetyltransferase n=1 Tax=Undibacterium sp. SXout11W TaxID=3413050 RepID=UPI003BF340B5